MTIEWLGGTCVKLTTSDCTIVIDPFGPDAGVRLPKLAPDVVAMTSSHADSKVVSGTPFIIDGAGEFEIKKLFVYGLPVRQNGNDPITLFLLEAEGVSFAHLGKLGHQLGTTELERLEGVDVLFVPVGGHGALNAEGASTLISAIEPRIVVPIQHKIQGWKENLDTVAAFAKELGTKESEQVEKFKFAAKDLPQDTMQIVILKP